VNRFEVQPVRLINDYFPRVHFSHRTHLVQEGHSGDDACVDCHPARRAADTQHLMIPSQDRCLKCHGNTPVRDRFVLECVSCHEYHSQR
jgi:hypothetical protein